MVWGWMRCSSVDEVGSFQVGGCMKAPRDIRGLVSVRGFAARSVVGNVENDVDARVVFLRRVKKVPSVPVVENAVVAATTKRFAAFGT